MYNLYYSASCQHCQRLLREYNTNGVNLVNINKSEYPQNVINVPTLEDVQKGNLYVGEEVFSFLKSNNLVEPFEFDSTNNMTSGFSFIDSDIGKYCEQEQFVAIEDI